MRLVSLYTYLDSIGGANNLCVILHNELMKSGLFLTGQVCSFTSYENLAALYKSQLTSNEYIKFKVMDLLNNADKVIFLSHHRKMTTYLLAMAKLLRKKITIIHIAHINLESLKHLTLFPKYNIAVSNNVKENLQEFFNVKDKVKVIYNGVPAAINTSTKVYNPEKIIITMPALIDERKQQVAITQFLKGKLPKEITIQYAGDGPNRKELETLVKDDSQFKVLGQVDDMPSLYQTSDYVLLFSKSEGLPLSLIEAQSYSVPIICNDVGGNLEILKPNENGFFADSFEELLNCLKSLPQVDASTYQTMQQKSLQNFKDNFQFDKMIEQYVDYIQEVSKKEF